MMKSDLPGVGTLQRTTFVESVPMHRYSIAPARCVIAVKVMSELRMSESTSTEADRSDDEQDLLDVAATDLDSADVARRALIEGYGYSEEELP